MPRRPRALLAAALLAVVAPSTVAVTTADAVPAKPATYPPPPGGAWLWEQELADGGFTLKKGSKQLKSVTFMRTDSTTYPDCPFMVPITVTGKVPIKRDPTVGDANTKAWLAAKAFKQNKFADYEGLKPLKVEVSVGGAAPVPGKLAMIFLKSDAGSYFATSATIAFGECLIHPPIAEPK